jgi:hypothetical protein
MVNILNDILGDARALTITFVGIAAIWFTAWTWIRTKSIVPTISSLMLGAIVVWGVSNYDRLQGEVDEDITRYSVDEG